VGRDEQMCPGPRLVQSQRDLAGVADDLRGDVQQRVAQPSRLGDDSCSSSISTRRPASSSEATSSCSNQTWFAV
jgi:hypothetical protein